MILDSGGGDRRARLVHGALVALVALSVGAVILESDPDTAAHYGPIAMVTGFVMLGLPVGIVATAFAEEIPRRGFVVTWSMVAKGLLFASLDASAIAEIMRYLRAQSMPAGASSARRGEPCRSMYFIAAGEVEIELPDAPVRLGEGRFFGEIALLRKIRLTAGVRATTPTKLLILDALDLHTFTQRNPEVGRHIEAVAASRAESHPERRDGDLIEAEIDDRDIPPRGPVL